MRGGDVAEIRPFRGVRYNMGITGGLREVIGPPEDIPSPERAAAIVQGRPFNCVRLEMPDVPGDDGFHEARRRYRQWLAEGVLIRDPVPALYLYEHEFTYDGRRLARRGFFAALRLTAPEAGDVLPHERILPQNLGLRTALLRHVRANLSAVYTLIADDGRVERVLAAVAA
ncbi:MAG: DUF1015 family protein, partial [Thermomicrobiaceae bacterium]|nr:DUF1015 family protein [Thermomicrobiaceae bacterium]